MSLAALASCSELLHTYDSDFEDYKLENLTLDYMHSLFVVFLS